MEESRLWGGLGIVLAVVGLLLIAPEVVHELSGGEGLTPLLFAVYGLGVLLSVVVTLAVVGPSVVSRSTP